MAAEWLAEHWETLQVVVFFAALGICGLAEGLRPRNREKTRRGARWPSNIGLNGLNIVLMLAIPVSVLSAASLAADRGWGLAHFAGLTGWGAVVVGIGARSLLAYAVHVLTHKVPVLWRLHRVHHTDTQMDVTTTVRLHPLEFAVTIPLHMAGVLLFGIAPLAIILYEVVEAAQTVITHANMRLPARLDRGLRWLVVTPDMHRMHHSSHQPETDSNYGTTVALWDHIFRTYTMRDADGLAAMELGLEDCQDARAASFTWLLTVPFLGPSLRSRVAMEAAS